MAADPRWEEAHASEELGRYPPEYLIRWVHRYFPRGPARDTARLLDLGCGQGAGTWLLAREGFFVDAVDASAAAVGKTRDFIEHEFPEAPVFVLERDATDLSGYGEGIFSGVVDNLCACHHTPTDGLRVMREVARVLRPGGYLLSVWPSSWSWAEPFERRGAVTLLAPECLGEVFGDHFMIEQV